MNGYLEDFKVSFLFIHTKEKVCPCNGDGFMNSGKTQHYVSSDVIYWEEYNISHMVVLLEIFDINKS
jgi:hypothetical protein